ncbi:hypothetical protein OIU84_004035 [Salix udensis]|uniref:Uncharacterized protein n=1 Tax=Salix udensis TaxID=889485 RepID=A0AAD6K3C7_9ROSI|nr:hypothetical protein OIU84_004035 [Salix udensis]
MIDLSFQLIYPKKGWISWLNVSRGIPESRWTAEELLDHPFITGNSQKKCACSPASVLDSFGTYEEEDDSDEPGNPDEHLRWNPFSMRDCGKPKIIAMRQHADNDFGSSGDWITISCLHDLLGFLIICVQPVMSAGSCFMMSFSAGDWRIKREESYDDEAAEEIK